MNTTRFNAAWLMEQTFPPVEYVVPGLIPEGMTLLAAAPKVGKSWFVLDLAISVSTGTNFLGSIHTGRARPVLYLALEDGPRRLQDRLKVLGVTTGPDLLDFQVATEDAIGSIRNWLTDHQESPVVILDTLGKVMPPAAAGESDYQRDYRVGGVLKSLVDDIAGAAMIVVHHTRKADSVDFLDSVSGTQGLAGSADSIVVIRRPRADKTGSLSVTSRDALEGEYQVALNDGRWSLDGIDLSAAAASLADTRTTANLGERSAEVVEFVNASPDGVRAADVADRLSLAMRELRNGTCLGLLTPDGSFGPHAASTPRLTPCPIRPICPHPLKDGTQETDGTHTWNGSASEGRSLRATAPQANRALQRLPGLRCHDRTDRGHPEGVRARHQARPNLPNAAPNRNPCLGP